MGFVDEDYNYTVFRKRPEASEEFRRGLPVGSRAPDFVAEELDGKQVRLADFRGKSNVVLEFGSSTCPPFINVTRYMPLSMEKLYKEFKPRGFEFFIVYTREAHPGEKVDAHRSMEQKRSQAMILRREEGMDIPIIIDDLRGSIHKAYYSRPNMVYVIDKRGVIVYRAEWTDPEQVARVLEEVELWNKLRESRALIQVVYSEKLHALPIDTWTPKEIKERVLSRAGLRSIEDWNRELGY